MHANHYHLRQQFSPDRSVAEAASALGINGTLSHKAEEALMMAQAAEGILRAAESLPGNTFAQTPSRIGKETFLTVTKQPEVRTASHKPSDASKARAAQYIAETLTAAYRLQPDITATTGPREKLAAAKPALMTIAVFYLRTAATELNGEHPEAAAKINTIADDLSAPLRLEKEVYAAQVRIAAKTVKAALDTEKRYLVDEGRELEGFEWPTNTIKRRLTMIGNQQKVIE